MMKVRDVEAADVPVLNAYWQGLSDDDIARMHIDRGQLRASEVFLARVGETIVTPHAKRLADPLIWELDGRAVGFTTLTNIERGKQAHIHLHLIDPSLRGKGLGKQWFALSLKTYFRRHNLEKIVCEPASGNPGPNGLMASLGIRPVRNYVTKPSPLCVEHEVTRYEIYGFGVTSDEMKSLNKKNKDA